MNGTPIMRIPAQDLRAMFNAADFPRQVAQGTMTTKIIADRHPSSPKAPVAICTRSQIVAYIKAGRRVALIHRYLQVDGTLGASGREDPKRLEVGGIVYLPDS